MFGVYAVNDRLQRLLADGVGMGPEDLAFDEDVFYTVAIKMVKYCGLIL